MFFCLQKMKRNKKDHEREFFFWYQNRDRWRFVHQWMWNRWSLIGRPAAAAALRATCILPSWFCLTASRDTNSSVISLLVFLYSKKLIAHNYPGHSISCSTYQIYWSTVLLDQDISLPQHSGPMLQACNNRVLTGICFQMSRRYTAQEVGNRCLGPCCRNAAARTPSMESSLQPSWLSDLHLTSFNRMSSFLDLTHPPQAVKLIFLSFIFFRKVVVELVIVYLFLDMVKTTSLYFSFTISLRQVAKIHGTFTVVFFSETFTVEPLCLACFVCEQLNTGPGPWKEYSCKTDFLSFLI